MYSTPNDSNQYQQQNYQYQTQYNYNQPLMDQGGSQFQAPYQNYPQQQPQQVEYQDYYAPPQSVQQNFAPAPVEADSWNISQNKASYVVSIPPRGTDGYRDHESLDLSFVAFLMFCWN